MTKKPANRTALRSSAFARNALARFSGLLFAPSFKRGGKTWTIGEKGALASLLTGLQLLIAKATEEAALKRAGA